MMFVRGLLLTVGLLIPASGFAQFDRVEEVLSRIEGQFTASQGFAPTGENLKGLIKPELIRVYLLGPLEWEIEKLETRAALLKEAHEDREKRLEIISRSTAEMTSELLEQGIKDQKDLDSIAGRRLQLRLHLNELNAEKSALQKSASAKAENEIDKLEVEAAMVVLERERASLELAASRLKSTEELYKSGGLPSFELQEQRAKLEAARAAVRLAELEVARQEAKMVVVPGLADKLRELTVMQERLQAELAEKSFEGTKLAALQGMLIDVQRKQLEREMSVTRLAEMREELEQLELEKRYLRRVLEKYKKAVGESQVKGSQPASQ